MPSFPFTQSVAAGATYLPLDGWQYEYLPFPAMVEILVNATAVGIVATISSGADTLMEEAPVQAGGTAGVIPSPLSTPALQDAAAAGDRLKIRVRNTSGGAVTVNGIINITPLR
jgi:hypothetical protein